MLKTYDDLWAKATAERQSRHAFAYRNVPDVINWPAASLIRNLVKEPPKRYMQNEGMLDA